jgi:hypothetical protein
MNWTHDDAITHGSMEVHIVTGILDINDTFVTIVAYIPVLMPVTSSFMYNYTYAMP